MTHTNPVFEVRLERPGGFPIRIGQLSVPSWCAFCYWDGDISFRVPPGISLGPYDVVIYFMGSDSDFSNNRAVFGTINVI